MTPTRWWFGLVALGGLAFGLLADRRPFGDSVFAHPLVAYFILVGIGLVLLRAVLARPVPEIIPERALVVGCFAGLAMFLVGNWLGVHLFGGGLPGSPGRLL
jgi:hypothetical protein